MVLDFQGEIALVTGANSGIGRATASKLSQYGAHVVGLDVNPTPHDNGPHFDDVVDQGELVVGDVSDGSDVAEALAVAKEAGPVTIAVNNAGIGSEGRIENVTTDGWRRGLAVHAEGTYNVCHRVVPDMASRGGGSVVNMSSIAGISGFPLAAEYSAAKGAIAALTRQLAVDYSPEGVRINAIAPGFIKTQMNADVWKSDEPIDEEEGVDYDTAVERTLLPRLGEPSDVADAVCFLASDAGSFITGQIIPVDGGWTAW